MMTMYGRLAIAAGRMMCKEWDVGRRSGPLDASPVEVSQTVLDMLHDVYE